MLCVCCVQLYRVNVLLQSPDSLDLSSKPPFFVLRRYSQFRQLHAEVSCTHSGKRSSMHLYMGSAVAATS
jgi:hypothetical protein